MEGATVKLNRAEAFLEVMKRTAVTTAQTQAQPDRTTVDADTRIVDSCR